jgi:hypothetical protein
MGDSLDARSRYREGDEYIQSASEANARGVLFRVKKT